MFLQNQVLNYTLVTNVKNIFAKSVSNFHNDESQVVIYIFFFTKNSLGPAVKINIQIVIRFDS